MKLTKQQLRRIIQERFSPTNRDIEQYLKDNAATYHKDPNLDPEAIAMLLRDDFMDDVGANVELTDEYENLINNLSQDPGAVMETTKHQLRRIIREEKAKLLNEYSSAPTIDELTLDIRNIIIELQDIAETTYGGQTETPDMGGPDYTQNEEVSSAVEQAMENLEGALAVLERPPIK